MIRLRRRANDDAIAETATQKAAPVVDDAADVVVEADSVRPQAEDDGGDNSEGTEDGDDAADVADAELADAETAVTAKRINWTRVLVYGVLPGLLLVLALTAGALKWQDSTVRAATTASVESVQAAKDATVALLSYKPDSVEQDLTAARDLLTGDFRDSYAQLTEDVVIPGSKQKQISALATVPAAASVSADPNHAVVLVFVNQTTTIGQDRPTDSASSVRVNLDKVGNRWLVSGFNPV